MPPTPANVSSLLEGTRAFAPTDGKVEVVFLRGRDSEDLIFGSVAYQCILAKLAHNLSKGKVSVARAMFPKERVPRLPGPRGTIAQTPPGTPASACCGRRDRLLEAIKEERLENTADRFVRGGRRTLRRRQIALSPFEISLL